MDATTKERIKVLIVEDHQDFADMLAIILNEIGQNNFELRHVALLETALKVLAREVYDVILLDLSLPDSRGLETFLDIHSHVPDVPVVVMTALDDQALALRAVREGAQDYLVKGDMDLTQLGRSLQYAVERHRTLENIRQQSLVDELTGLLNRRGFISQARQHLKIAQRTHRELLLFFGDLDGLKLINDTYGHNEGDNALRLVAGILKSTFRSSDLVARLGGDEFTILAIDAPGEQGPLLLERLEEKVQQHNRPGAPYRLSLSVGMSRFDPEKPLDLEDLLDAADRALYERKRLRRTIG